MTFQTKETVLCMLASGVWKKRFDAYTPDGALGFTLRCRDFLGLDYDAADADGNIIGRLTREGWRSPVMQVSDADSGRAAKTMRLSPSLREEFSLDLDRQSICLFQERGSLFTSLSCCSLDDSQIHLDLMLSAGVLLLEHKPVYVHGGYG